MNMIHSLIALGFVLLTGAVMLLVVTSPDTLDVGDDAIRLVTDDPNEQFEPVEKEPFFEQLFLFWKQNQFADHTVSKVFLVNDTGVITKRDLFNFIKSNNLCKSMQSLAFDCGGREDVVMQSIAIPSFIRATYVNDTLVLEAENTIPEPARFLRMKQYNVGGYIGNGDMTIGLQSLPGDAIIERVLIEYYANSDFALYINGSLCGMMYVQPYAVRQDITGCAEDIYGAVNMSVDFSHDPDRSTLYGFIMTVLYSSTTAEGSISSDRLYLPAADTLVKYYSSLYFPSSPSSATMHLEYEVPGTEAKPFRLFVNNNQKIGKDVLGVQTENVDLGPGLLKGPTLFHMQVGYDNATSYEIKLPAPTDTVLVTDISGSMGCDLDADNPQSCMSDGRDQGLTYGGDCTHPDLMSIDTQKLLLAKCFGIGFVSDFLGLHISNRLGLVAFSSSSDRTKQHDLSRESTSLIAKLNTYENPLGGTCVSCSIASSMELLASSTNAKVMVLMTDGVANHCIPGTGCGEGPAFAEAREQAQLAVDNNITIFTIAFAINDPEGKALMEEIACMDDCSHYKEGNDPEQLQEIYKSIIQEINVLQSTAVRYGQGYEQSEQTPAKVLKNSYIDYTFSSLSMSSVNLFVQDEVACDGSFQAPLSGQLRISDARLYSWSGNSWTDEVLFNGNSVYSLSSIGDNYSQLGDAFTIWLDPAAFTMRNTVEVRSGNIRFPASTCVKNATIQYHAEYVPGVTKGTGCHWHVESAEGVALYTIPESYIGTQFCEYTRKKISYDNGDDVQKLTLDFFGSFDENKDGVVDYLPEYFTVLGGLP